MRFHWTAGFVNAISSSRVTSPLTRESTSPPDPETPSFAFVFITVDSTQLGVRTWSSLSPVGTVTLCFFASSRSSFSGQEIRADHFTAIGHLLRSGPRELLLERFAQAGGHRAGAPVADGAPLDPYERV